MILGYVSGYKIEFLNEPHQSDIPRPYRQDKHHASILQLQIDDLVEKNVVTQIFDVNDAFVSNVFLRPKKGGKFRMIIDLSDLNEFVEKIKFKMDTLSSSLDLIYPGAFLTSVDLKDAYHSVPIWSGHKRFLTFQWDNKFYRFNVLPFGLTSAPRVFTKLLKPLCATLREKGISCVFYIDDCLIVSDLFESAVNDCKLMCEGLRALGFTINEEKSSLSPATSITFLGYVIDNISMEIRPTLDKVENTLPKIANLISGSQFVIREVAQVIGFLVDLCKGVEYGLGHYKELEKDKIKALRKSGNQGFDGRMTLSEKAKDDLRWWQSHLTRASKKIRVSAPEITLTTDASNQGWGAVSDNLANGGRWTTFESQWHINALEMQAVLLGLESFHEDTNHEDILILSDNSTTIAYINKMGGTHSFRCNKIARKIWDFAEKRKLWLVATHIPGLENEEADFLSRNFSDDTEWSLCSEIFQIIIQNWGKPDIDLFASRLNHKVDKFVSWFNEPGTLAVNAFTLNWNKLGLIYVFPPFRLTGRVIQKIRADRADALLVTPNWPGQIWYGQISSKQHRDLLFFPRQRDNLRTDAPHLRDNHIANIPLVVIRFWKGR